MIRDGTAGSGDRRSVIIGRSRLDLADWATILILGDPATALANQIPGPMIVDTGSGDHVFAVALAPGAPIPEVVVVRDRYSGDELARTDLRAIPAAPD